MTDASKTAIVQLRDFAAELGLTAGGARRYLMRRNTEMFTRIAPDRGGQHVLCLTREEANRILALREAETI